MRLPVEFRQLDTGVEHLPELDLENDVVDRVERRRTERWEAEEESVLFSNFFVSASIRAAVMLFVVQVIASLAVSNLAGAQLRFAKWKFIPYLAIAANEETFIKTVSWSTIAAVITTCAMALWVLNTRRDEPAMVYGWGTGIIMSAFLVFFQYLRGWIQPPGGDTWILLQAGGITAATALIFIGFRPDDEDSVPKETPEGHEKAHDHAGAINGVTNYRRNDEA